MVNRPRARYGLPHPPRGSFVDHDFLKAYCLRSILQHVSPLAVGALGGSFVDHDFLKAYCLRSILQHVSPLAVGALGGNSLL